MNIYPRDVAIRVLTRVLSENESLDDALDRAMVEVPPPVLGWLQDVCSGTLRWKGRLDSILDSIATRKKPSGWLRKALLIAAYQLVVQDRVHAGAVVSETVSAVKAKEGEAPAKFANACLRKVAEYAQKWRVQTCPKTRDSEVLAAWASLPIWIWKKIVKQQGLEWAIEYAQASLERPILWICAKDPQWQPQWAQSGPIPRSWNGTEGGAVSNKPGFLEGQFIVQDISGQLLVKEIAEKIRSEKNTSGLTALDYCAAPGGKSVGMAWEGFQVTATDRVEKRVVLLKQTVARAAPEIEVLPWEGLPDCEKKDLVWVDAPCSGTGILRRHPDVRWLRKEKELEELIRTQREVLRAAWDKVKSGGYLAYSVCSVLQEEGPDAVKESALPGAELVAQWHLFPQKAPYGDGFWAALLRKN